VTILSKTYYLFSSGRLRRQDYSLVLETNEGKQPIPIENIDHIYCFSEMDINSRLLELLSQKQVCIHFFNYYGHYTGSFIPKEALLSGFLVVKQVEHYLNYEQRLVLARFIVEGAIHNIRRNIEKKGI